MPKISSISTYCPNCDHTGIVWVQSFRGDWLQIDLDTERAHACSKGWENPINRYETMYRIQCLGFSAYQPLCTSWQWVFTASNNTDTLFLMVGRHTMDIRLHQAHVPIETTPSGKLIMKGGVIIRNYYNGTKVNIHHHILEISSRFVSNAELTQNHLTPLGYSPRSTKTQQSSLGGVGK